MIPDLQPRRHPHLSFSLAKIPNFWLKKSDRHVERLGEKASEVFKQYWCLFCGKNVEWFECNGRLRSCPPCHAPQSNQVDKIAQWRKPQHNSGTHEQALILGTFQSLCLTLAPLEALFEQVHPRASLTFTSAIPQMAFVSHNPFTGSVRSGCGHWTVWSLFTTGCHNLMHLFETPQSIDSMESQINRPIDQSLHPSTLVLSDLMLGGFFSNLSIA